VKLVRGDASADRDLSGPDIDDDGAFQGSLVVYSAAIWIASCSVQFTMARAVRNRGNRGIERRETRLAGDGINNHLLSTNDLSLSFAFATCHHLLAQRPCDY
jgi:hypothetical protein